VARWMFHRGTISLSILVKAKIVRDANRAIAETRRRIEPSRFRRACRANGPFPLSYPEVF
jgi:hypothetical protein